MASLPKFVCPLKCLYDTKEDANIGSSFNFASFDPLFKIKLNKLKSSH